jgi:hypothetical protein
MGIQTSPWPTLSPSFNSIEVKIPSPALGIVDSAKYRLHDTAGDDGVLDPSGSSDPSAFVDGILDCSNNHSSVVLDTKKNVVAFWHGIVHVCISLPSVEYASGKML